MIGVSKTFGGSSILSSPVRRKMAANLDFTGFAAIFDFAVQCISECLKVVQSDKNGVNLG